ncbi:sigma-70 family RNA polymerase sigma factor [Paenibacillus tengchongensis]|uniref:sigma-70 family RNA polymerase sigma factor n=1 Tax=Paenibacillus tengchongensis TaxID=2608684 RepID=UPI001FE7579D|nr:sigma-70 family RNA polymerase sigma factor [Paenibacillus tengchongensis]
MGKRIWEHGGFEMMTCDEELVETCRKLLKRSAWRIQYKTRIQQLRESRPIYDNQVYDASFESMVISEMFVDEMLQKIPWEKCRYIIKRTIIDGLAEKEVARELNMTQQGVSKWKRKGLDILKEQLDTSLKL